MLCYAKEEQLKRFSQFAYFIFEEFRFFFSDWLHVPRS